MRFPNLSLENILWDKGFSIVAGADEVGRGSFAGPVVSAVVAFSKSINQLVNNSNSPRIDDSKKLTAKQREIVDKWIKENSIAWGIGVGSVTLINHAGIVKATNFAFRSAIKLMTKSLDRRIDYLLIDAFYIPRIGGIRKSKQKPIIRGDEKSVSIASAAILAKVYRDNLMIALNKKCQKYLWDKNKGYGTRQHRDAILKYGVTKYHRKAFVD